MDAVDDRYAGCLVGQALGDALGFVVEGQGPEACRRYLDGLEGGVHLDTLRRGRFPFGQYSDDTQLARELMASFVACGRFDAADYGGRIAALFTDHRIVGRGRATEAAALRLASGVAPEAAGAPAPVAGNGSAMRAAPVGLFHPGDPARIAEVARRQGEITHRDPRASAGAVAVALATNHALRDDEIDRAALIAHLAARCGDVSADFGAGLARLEAWLELTPDEAVVAIAGEGKAPDHVEEWPGISPFVTGSVLWSLYSWLRHPDDYRDAVFCAIAPGGDVDTTAAMTGAIAGCRVGLAGLPRWAERVNDQGQWGHAELAELARACRGRARAGGP